MNVLRVAVLLSILTVAISRADETNALPTTITIDGEKYEDVRWGTVTPVSVQLRHSGGVVGIPLEKLPKELQQRFGYDLLKANAYRAQQAEYETFKRETTGKALLEGKVISLTEHPLVKLRGWVTAGQEGPMLDQGVEKTRLVPTKVWEGSGRHTYERNTTRRVTGLGPGGHKVLILGWSPAVGAGQWTEVSACAMGSGTYRVPQPISFEFWKANRSLITPEVGVPEQAPTNATPRNTEATNATAPVSQTPAQEPTTANMAPKRVAVTAATAATMPSREEEKAAPALERNPNSWEEGTVGFRACQVITVSEGGLVVEAERLVKVTTPIQTGGPGGFGGGFGAFASPGVSKEKPAVATRTMTTDPHVIAVVNHPKQKSLAEGDEFSCVLKRSGSVEWKDTEGNLRRLPRWVYVADN